MRENKFNDDEFNQAKAIAKDRKKLSEKKRNKRVRNELKSYMMRDR